MSVFKDKVLLITGGTGSFGNAVLRRFLDSDIKEIRMGPSIGDNDFNTKLKNGMKFLADGDRLKVTVRFRGREMAHTEIGEVLLKDFAERCAEIAVLDKVPKLEGRNMTIFLSPKPVTPPKKPGKAKQPKQQAAAEAENKAE